MTVIDQIHEKFPYLTRKQRDVANYMLEDPERMSYVTLKEISQDTGITEMTILKTCSLLGFASFSSMKYEFRRYAAMQLEQFRAQSAGDQLSSVPENEPQSPELLLKDICDAESKIASTYLSNLNPKQLFEAADQILDADKILLFGRGVSYHICSYASSLFSSMGRGCVAVNTELYDDVYAALPLLTSKSLVIVVAFPDYYRTTLKIAEYAHKSNVSVMALTDNERSPICAYSNFNLFIPSQSRMFLNNLAMPMEMINLLATAINLRLGSKTNSKLETVNRYNAFVDFEI